MKKTNSQMIKRAAELALANRPILDKALVDGRLELEAAETSTNPAERRGLLALARRSVEAAEAAQSVIDRFRLLHD